AEKIYRSLGPDAEIRVKLDISSSGTLGWLPQETILFDQIRLRRSIEADLAPDASLLLAEGVVFGRAAMGETLAHGHFFDRWRVRRAGVLIFAESLRLDGAVADQLARRAVAGGAVAIASVLKVPGDEAAGSGRPGCGERFRRGSRRFNLERHCACAARCARRRRIASRLDCCFDRVRQYAAAATMAELEHDPEKAWPDLIGGGNRFSEKSCFNVCRELN